MIAMVSTNCLLAASAETLNVIWRTIVQWEGAFFKNECMRIRALLPLIAYSNGRQYNLSGRSCELVDSDGSPGEVRIQTTARWKGLADDNGERSNIFMPHFNPAETTWESKRKYISHKIACAGMYEVRLYPLFTARAKFHNIIAELTLRDTMQSFIKQKSPVLLAIMGNSGKAALQLQIYTPSRDNKIIGSLHAWLRFSSARCLINALRRTNQRIYLLKSLSAVRKASNTWLVSWSLSAPFCSRPLQHLRLNLPLTLFLRLQCTQTFEIKHFFQE